MLIPIAVFTKPTGPAAEMWSISLERKLRFKQEPYAAQLALKASFCIIAWGCL